jgi:ribosomal protein L37E
MDGAELGVRSAESHARCPRCEYDLTGLPEPRCPECGFVFSWDDLPRLRNPPTIAFERWSGWGRMAGFVWTAVTVLLTPWIFARQCVRRMNWRAGLLFGACCFATTPISLVFGADVAFLVAWVATGAIYIFAQAVVLSVLDWQHWRDGVASWRFWLGIGGYTSAVVMTELYRGPPQIELSSIADLFNGGRGAFFRMPSEPLVHWTQMLLWIAGLVCIRTARLRERGARWGRVTAAVVTTVVLVYMMYALAIEHVGMRIHDWLD